jgi:hypothetical protein
MRHSANFVCALGVAACNGAGPPAVPGAGSGASASGESGQFIAYASNFAGYHAWPHIDIVDDAGGGGAAHLDTNLTEYMLAPPPPKGTPFPVGTLIVKQGQVEGLAAGQAFAMAKRGGGYNDDGAAGWEWFELQTLPGGGDAVTIVWRGVAPPAGETYSGNVSGDCNQCHQGAPHDGVFAE